MRWQLPLILAYSITTDKSQSMTAHNGIVYEPSKNKPFARGLPYAAISRATDSEKVALLLPIRPDHFIKKIFIAEFYNNLKFNVYIYIHIRSWIHDSEAGDPHNEITKNNNKKN